MQKVTYLVLNYNRPKETELCLYSIKNFSRFPHQVVLLNNGGSDEDFSFDFYKKGLVDKLILRRENSGCGLGTRELFNDFDIFSNHVIYVQCDQFMYREVGESEVQDWINKVDRGEYFYIDLAGNQGGGRPSERASFYNKNDYKRIKFLENEGHGPGPYAHLPWTEEILQKYMYCNGLSFYTVNPLVFMDNGKNSIREYPCGGILMQETDTKAVHILKPILKRIDFPNIKFSDNDWDLILNNKWKNGTVPLGHLGSSFKCWNRPAELGDFIKNV